MSVSFISYGATVTDVVTLGRNGERASIVLGSSAQRDYETKR